MPQRGKNYEDALKGFRPRQVYPPVEAVKHVKASAKAKFDETVELSMRLGVDPRKADQIVRGTVSLPGGTGKNVRVAVFAAGPAAEEAVRPAPTSSAPKTWWNGLSAGSSTSTSPSPRRTSWVRSVRPPACSVPASSCRTPRRAPSPPTSPRPSASSRAARWSTAPTRSATSTCRSARPASSRRRCWRTSAPWSTRCSGQAGVGQGQVHQVGHRVSTMGPGVRVDTNRLGSPRKRLAS